MAFDTETGRIREHGGHPGVCPDCPEECLVCDGTGWVHKVLTGVGVGANQFSFEHLAVS